MNKEIVRFLLDKGFKQTSLSYTRMVSFMLDLPKNHKTFCGLKAKQLMYCFLENGDYSFSTLSEIDDKNEEWVIFRGKIETLEQLKQILELTRYEIHGK